MFAHVSILVFTVFVQVDLGLALKTFALVR